MFNSWVKNIPESGVSGQALIIAGVLVMIKYFACIFVISVSLFCISSISEVKPLAVNHKEVNLKSSEKEACQSRNSSQSRSNAPL